MSIVNLDRVSLQRLVRETLDRVDTESQTLGHAFQVLSDATRELPPSSTPRELRRGAVALRGGVLQVFVSIANILTGLGKLELVADALDIADGDRPNS